MKRKGDVDLALARRLRRGVFKTACTVSFFGCEAAADADVGRNVLGLESLLGMLRYLSG